MRIQSPSSISTYLHCPRKYYYIYVKKIKIKPSIHLVRGTIAHSVLEDFFDLPNQIVNELNFFNILKMHIENLFVHYWDKNSGKLNELGLDEKTLQFYFDETLVMLLNWWDIFSKKIEKEIANGNNFQSSFKIMTPVREQHYISQKLSVQGYVDALFKKGDDDIIIDYKTSKRSEITEAYRLQLGIYSILYQEKFGKFPYKVGLFFLKDDEILIKPDESLIVNAIEKINHVHKMTESLKIEDYPMKPGPLCKWRTGCCDFYNKCFQDGI